MEAMIRTIITPDHKNLTLSLPDDFLGKQIEIIAFVIDEAISKNVKKVTFTVLEVPEEIKRSYQFNRDEANER